MEAELMGQIDGVFPQRMREYREEAGLNQKEIADKLCVNRVTYIYYESGKRQPGYVFVRDFSRLSGWSPSYLLGLSQYRTLDQEADAFQLTPEGASEAAAAASLIRQTAKKLLDRYNKGEERIFSDYLEPLANVCNQVDNIQRYFSYEKAPSNKIVKEAYADFDDQFQAAYKACNALLERGFS